MKLLLVVSALLAASACFIYRPVPSGVSEPWKLMLLDACTRFMRTLVREQRSETRTVNDSKTRKLISDRYNRLRNVDFCCCTETLVQLLRDTGNKTPDKYLILWRIQENVHLNLNIHPVLYVYVQVVKLWLHRRGGQQRHLSPTDSTVI